MGGTIADHVQWPWGDRIGASHPQEDSPHPLSPRPAPRGSDPPQVLRFHPRRSSPAPHTTPGAPRPCPSLPAATILGHSCTSWQEELVAGAGTGMSPGGTLAWPQSPPVPSPGMRCSRASVSPAVRWGSAQLAKVTVAASLQVSCPAVLLCPRPTPCRRPPVNRRGMESLAGFKPSGERKEKKQQIVRKEGQTSRSRD